MFNIDPNGTVDYRGVKVPTILCHWDSYKLCLGSGHSDIYTWFGKYNKDMTTIRKDVTALLKGTSNSTPTKPPVTTPITLKAGDLISIKNDATYYNGKAIPKWVLAKNWYIYSIKGDRAVINQSEDGTSAIMSSINTKFLTKVSEKQDDKFIPYLIRVTANVLNVRSGPGTNYLVTTTIKKGGIYTIVDEKNGWGKLKSGAGWISLKYTEKR